MRGLRGFPKLYHQAYSKNGVRYKTKTWYADVWKDGICKRIAFGLDKKAALQALKLAVSDRGFLDGHTVSLDDILQWVEDDYRANARKSLPNLLPKIIRLRGFFVSSTKAAEITSDRIRAYQAQRQAEGAKNGTINNELAVLARGFSLGLVYDRLKTKPKIPRLKESPARKGFFERPEFEAVVSNLPLALQPVAWTCYLTGWRPRSEVLTRRWSHVDFRAGTLRLEPQETKNTDGRTFPFGPELLAVLHGQRERCSQLERQLGRVIPWVYFTDRGDRITHYQRAWDSARRAAGMPHKLLYDTRRTRVRNFERAGVPRSAGMALVGHRTQAIYSRYAITDEAMLREAVNKADTFEQGQPQAGVKVNAIGRKKVE